MQTKFDTITVADEQFFAVIADAEVAETVLRARANQFKAQRESAAPKLLRRFRNDERKIVAGHIAGWTAIILVATTTVATLAWCLSHVHALPV